MRTEPIICTLGRFNFSKRVRHRHNEKYYYYTCIYRMEPDHIRTKFIPKKSFYYFLRDSGQIETLRSHRTEIKRKVKGTKEEIRSKREIFNWNTFTPGRRSPLYYRIGRAERRVLSYW